MNTIEHRSNYLKRQVLTNKLGETVTIGVI